MSSKEKGQQGCGQPLHQLWLDSVTVHPVRLIVTHRTHMLDSKLNQNSNFSNEIPDFKGLFWSTCHTVPVLRGLVPLNWFKWSCDLLWQRRDSLVTWQETVQRESGQFWVTGDNIKWGNQSSRQVSFKSYHSTKVNFLSLKVRWWWLALSRLHCQYGEVTLIVKAMDSALYIQPHWSWQLSLVMSLCRSHDRFNQFKGTSPLKTGTVWQVDQNKPLKLGILFEVVNAASCTILEAKSLYYIVFNEILSVPRI